MDNFDMQTDTDVFNFRFELEKMRLKQYLNLNNNFIFKYPDVSKPWFGTYGKLFGNLCKDAYNYL